jgi:hypothetical protein
MFVLIAMYNKYSSLILQAIYLMLLSLKIGGKYSDVSHSTAVANLCYYYYVPVMYSSTLVWSCCIMDVLAISRTRCRHTTVSTHSCTI